MDGDELRKRLKADTFIGDDFLNVFALNELPKEKIRRKVWCLVLNCCPRWRVGEHWLAVYYQNGQLDFFDSFGLAPNIYGDELIQFFQAQEARDVFYNARMLQNLTSVACGYYCTLFLICRARGESMKNVVKTMLRMEPRDEFVMNIVRELDYTLP